MENSKKEFNEYVAYKRFLVGNLQAFKEFSSHVSFLNEMDEKACFNFFSDNLFLFKQCIDDLYIFSEEQRSLIKNMYEKIELYHYTDYDSLKRIITDNSLKFNNILKMNDYLEGKLLIHAEAEANHFALEHINSEFIKILSNKLPLTYSFSFSTCKDDAAQWDRYGKPKEPEKKVTIASLWKIYDKTKEFEKKTTRSGVCIKVSMAKLMKLVEKIRSDFLFADLTPILYSSYPYNYDTNIRYLRALVNFRSKPERNKGLTYEDWLTVYSSAIKHKSFRNEREIRLLLLMPETLPHYLERVKQDKNDYVLLKFIDIFKDFDMSSLISSITIGPGSNHNEVKSQVEQLLKDKELDTKIKVSESLSSLR